MKYLIVSADDFGLSRSLNEGIIKALREGIVTFLNIMPAGEAFDDALKLAREAKVEEIGAHLALTGTAPLTDPRKIPSLVTEEGTFHKDHNRFFLNLFLRKIGREHIYIELKSQLDRLVETGLRLTNLSSHENIHMMPEILDIFVKLAGEYNIPSIRYPHKERLIPPLSIKKIYKSLILAYLENSMDKILKESGIAYTDNFLGFFDAGNLQEETVIRMLESLEEGTTELVCHPGFLSPEVLDRCIFHLRCETDLASLTSRHVKKIIKEKDIELVTYREFLSIKK